MTSSPARVAPITPSTLQLDPLSVDHAFALYQLTIGNRDHLRAWLPWVDHIRVMEDTLAFVTDAVERTQQGEQTHWMMRVGDDWVGIISIVDIADGQGTVGYWISASHQRQGHTSGGVAQVVKHAFNEMGLTRLRLEYLEGNEASRRVAERNGFRKVETRAGDTLNHGQPTDRHICMREASDF